MRHGGHVSGVNFGVRRPRVTGAGEDARSKNHPTAGPVIVERTSGVFFVSRKGGVVRLLGCGRCVSGHDAIGHG